MADQIIAFRADVDLISSMDETARKLGVTRSELARLAVERFTTNAKSAEYLEDIVMLQVDKIISIRLSKLQTELVDRIHKKLPEIIAIVGDQA